MYRIYALVNAKLDRYAGPYFEKDITDILSREKLQALAIDLQKVTFIDSAGLGTMVRILKAVTLAGAKLYLCSASEQVEMLLEQSGLYERFRHCHLQDFPDHLET
ncbi:STAS domain-containing protein [Neosynechococcus sphagnicola]|uniref:STAS domain-containing protein n=1 Tax=Neosynechococcus sphagnicola TaxID=1501145 RepID=UPI00068DA285|nr:STAS domain-containing protein [Neosynechococcus sphagnicola]